MRWKLIKAGRAVSERWKRRGPKGYVVIAGGRYPIVRLRLQDGRLAYEVNMAGPFNTGDGYYQLESPDGALVALCRLSEDLQHQTVADGTAWHLVLTLAMVGRIAERARP